MLKPKKVILNLNGPMFMLTVLFIIFKVTGIIDWSWLWVLCPIWIPFAFMAGIWLFVVGVAILAFCAALVSEHGGKFSNIDKRRKS